MHAERYDAAESNLQAYSKSPAIDADTEPERKALQALLVALPSLKAGRAVSHCRLLALHSLGHRSMLSLLLYAMCNAVGHQATVTGCDALHPRAASFVCRRHLGHHQRRGKISPGDLAGRAILPAAGGLVKIDALFLRQRGSRPASPESSGDAAGVALWQLLLGCSAAGGPPALVPTPTIMRLPKLEDCWLPPRRHRHCSCASPSGRRLCRARGGAGSRRQVRRCD